MALTAWFLVLEFCVNTAVASCTYVAAPGVYRNVAACENDWQTMHHSLAVGLRGHSCLPTQAIMERH